MSYPDCYGSSLPYAGELGVSALNRMLIAEGKIPKYFHGNKKTKVYHKSTCHCVNMILPDNLENVDGEDFTDEKGREYRACAKCLPNFDMEIEGAREVPL